jgi:undecaprenyl-diphosphatase
VDVTHGDTRNSFPSDHAALFFSIAVGFYFISRRIFLFAFLYVLIFIAVPRVYLGLHYPTDILSGALIGMAAAVVCNIWHIAEQTANRVLRFSDRNPRLFYPALFTVTYQISDLFDAARIIAGHLYNLLLGA